MPFHHLVEVGDFAQRDDALRDYTYMHAILPMELLQQEREKAFDKFDCLCSLFLRCRAWPSDLLSSMIRFPLTQMEEREEDEEEEKLSRSERLSYSTGY